MGVSILPGPRSPWDLIGASIGSNISQNLPGAVQQGYQRQLGMNALQQAEQDIAQAGGDPYKIALAFAKAGAQNPALERSLGPLASLAMNKSIANTAYPAGAKSQPSAPANIQNGQNVNQENLTQGNVKAQEPGLFDQPVSDYGIIPQIFTQEQIDEKAKELTRISNDPASYPTHLQTLQNKNQQAMQQLGNLEKYAEDQGISRENIPEFMQVGKQFNYITDPYKWVTKTQQAFGPYQNAKDQLKNAFIPDFFRGLMNSPKEREEALKRLDEPIATILKMNPALEPKLRTQLASQNLSPTEIEARIHPMTKETESSLEKIPKGLFPNKMVESPYSYFPVKEKSPFVSYEEAKEKSPRQMAVMNKRLVNFFKENLKNDTPILPLRDKLVFEKDYDWRQVADAVKEAVAENDVKLGPYQQAELVELNQEPRPSMSRVFQSWGNWMDYIRGQK